MEDSIKALRQFFTVTVAAFEFGNVIRGLYSKDPVTELKMHTLHKQALIELEKDEPNMVLIDKLLEAIEDEAVINKNIEDAKNNNS
jgi:hypothetical protein